ncbi:MAG: hypothetical protein A2142_08595 [candidate division Zixibacteria bacterium RBG_16_48_11]|nr:MAG: hypothetical protein A2142_08595 [candidate division Zixibacteria bacterium RBG_16_48_11]
MFKQVDYVMVVVSDMQKSIKFYRDILGLPLKFESPEWTEFQTGATTLALHGGGVRNPDPPGGTDERQLAGNCSIGFTVENLQKAFEELKSRGGKFTMPPTQRDKEGIILAVCLDPDGMPVSLAEALKK